MSLSSWCFHCVAFVPEQVGKELVFRTLASGSATDIKWFKRFRVLSASNVCSHISMPPCCSRRWLLSNPPASSTCRKAGRRPHMEVSGLTGRQYIDNPPQNCFTMKLAQLDFRCVCVCVCVCMCVCSWGCICVCVCECLLAAGLIWLVFDQLPPLESRRSSCFRLAL